MAFVSPALPEICQYIEALWKQPQKSKVPFANLDFLRVQGLKKVFLPQRALSLQSHHCPPVTSVVWMVSVQVADASTAA